MKRICILILFFVSASCSLEGMDFLKKNVQKILHAIRMKYNEPYRIEQTIANNMRAIPFMYLKEKYMHLDTSEISKEDINELNNCLVEKNKLSKKALIQDLNNCLINYNDIYLKQRNESNNKDFLDTVIPTLFAGQDFSKTESKSIHSHSMPPDSLLICSRQNPYLMSCLLYVGKVSFKKKSDKLESNPRLLNILNLLTGSGFISNGSFDAGDNDESHIKYIKAIYTPPALFIKKIKKDALFSIQTFLCCLNRLKKRSLSYKVARPVINNIILYFIIKNAIPKEVNEQCSTVAQNAHEQITSLKMLTSTCKEKSYSHDMYNFMSHGFAQWAENNMDPAWLTLQDLMFKK